jgi:hypothetical protein
LTATLLLLLFRVSDEVAEVLLEVLCSDGVHVAVCTRGARTRLAEQAGMDDVDRQN